LGRWCALLAACAAPRAGVGRQMRGIRESEGMRHWCKGGASHWYPATSPFKARRELEYSAVTQPVQVRAEDEPQRHRDTENSQRRRPINTMSKAPLGLLCAPLCLSVSVVIPWRRGPCEIFRNSSHHFRGLGPIVGRIGFRGQLNVVVAAEATG